MDPEKLAEQNAMLSALLRITIQSFDSGGESMRSQRAMAVETAWSLITDTDDPRVQAAYKECDADRWAYISKARHLAFMKSEETNERD